MKLLLTSTGLTDSEIKRVFFDLINKDPKEIVVAFISTAARTPEELKYTGESKIELIESGILENNIIDIKIDDKRDQQNVYESDVLYVCGGNTFYLLDQVQRTGFGEVIKKFIKAGKLYFGVSAGTILITPNIDVANIEPADTNDVNLKDLTGIKIINFEISPHTPEIVSWENVEKYSTANTNKLYAISDKTAIVVNDKNVEIIGEKRFKIYNQ